jgi:DNA-directed RNA polymerase specialized sigma24 family protein
MMKQAKSAEVFEQVIISYARMCYSVAFALTRDQKHAEDLAKHTLTWAWNMRDRSDSKKDIKNKLLKIMRERFLQYYRQDPDILADEAAIGEEILCIAQDAEWSTEKDSHTAQIVMFPL